MVNPGLSPKSTAYTTPATNYRQRVLNNEEVILAPNSVSVDVLPRVINDGYGRGYLVGQITIDADPIVNMPLCNLPNNMVPIATYLFPVSVLRSGAYVANAIRINTGALGISQVIVNDPGQYSVVPTLIITGEGTGADLSAVMSVVYTYEASTPGTGYVPGDTIDLAGGTFTQRAQLRVQSTLLASAQVNNTGSGYFTGDTITTVAANGTQELPAILIVATTTLKTVQIQTAGTGYKVGDTIVVSGGVASPPATLEVAGIGSGGAINSVFVVDGGSYTSDPSTLSQLSTSGSGTGAIFNNPSFGVDTVAVSSSNKGRYTLNPSNLNQFSTSGSGTGATFNILSFGVDITTITIPGSYTVIANNPVSQQSTSGSGTGVTFSLLWGIQSVTVESSGVFLSRPNIVTSGAHASEASLIAEMTNNNAGAVNLINAPQVGDVVIFSTSAITFLPNHTGAASGG